MEIKYCELTEVEKEIVREAYPTDYENREYRFIGVELYYSTISR